MDYLQQLIKVFEDSNRTIDTKLGCDPRDFLVERLDQIDQIFNNPKGRNFVNVQLDLFINFHVRPIIDQHQFSLNVTSFVKDVANSINERLILHDNLFKKNNGKYVAPYDSLITAPADIVKKYRPNYVAGPVHPAFLRRVVHDILVSKLFVLLCQSRTGCKLPC